MNLKYTGITGFKDILPETIHVWYYIENICKQTFNSFGYREIRTPLLEKTELFRRSIGETTDIVEKEMYSFIDKNGESLTLRPEGTASVVRSYIENNIGMREQIFKIFYIGPMFRHERPQKGRLRQFHQIGAEIFNISAPSAEAELLLILHSILKKLRVSNLKLQINSVGCSNCRPEYSKELKKYLKSNINKLCENCKRRSEKNPLRSLDCKNEKCRIILDNAPVISEYLCDACKIHFNDLQSYLKELDINYLYNPSLVRGLDYYTRTAFEIVTPEDGAQNAVAAGGRYDNLVESFGGNPTPAIGFAIGMERLIRFVNVPEDIKTQPELFIATIGKEVYVTALKLALPLREKGIYVEMGYGDKSLKSQMRLADKLKTKYVLIIGEDELKSKTAILKNMSNSEQEIINIQTQDDFLNSLKGKII